MAGSGDIKRREFLIRSFGEISLDPWQRALRAALVDINDVTVFEKTLTAVE